MLSPEDEALLFGGKILIDLHVCMCVCVYIKKIPQTLLQAQRLCWWLENPKLLSH